MTWEDYLDLAVQHLANPYEARRWKATVRQYLLIAYEQQITAGADPDTAMSHAMDQVGDPTTVVPVSVVHHSGHQRLLWMSQLLTGLILLGAGWMTSSMDLSLLGRLMSVTSVMTSGWSAWTRSRGQTCQRTLLSLRMRSDHWQGWRHWPWRDIGRSVVAGVVAAVVVAQPWGWITTATPHPMWVGDSLSLGLASMTLAIVGIPWWRGSRWPLSVGRQVVMALIISGSYTAVLWMVPRWVPPPIFLWSPPLWFLGGVMVSLVWMRCGTGLAFIHQRLAP